MGSPQRDIAIMREAIQMEHELRSYYELLVDSAFVRAAPARVRDATERALAHHREHVDALQSHVVALGSRRVSLPTLDLDFGEVNEYEDIVNTVRPLQERLAKLYTDRVSELADSKSRSVWASILGVEAQHLTVLNVTAGLLKSGNGALPGSNNVDAVLPIAEGLFSPVTGQRASK